MCIRDRADPTTLPRSRRLSPAVRTGLNTRPGRLGGVQPGRMVVPRVPGQEDQSAWQAGRPPRPAPGSSVRLGKLVEHRAGRLVPPGRLVEPRGPRSDDDSCRGGWSNPQTPCMEAEYSRARWSSPAALARTLSPAGPAGRAPRPGASAVGVRGASSLRTTRPASVGSSRNVHVPTTSGVPPRPTMAVVRSVRKSPRAPARVGLPARAATPP